MCVVCFGLFCFFLMLSDMAGEFFGGHLSCSSGFDRYFLMFPLIVKNKESPPYKIYGMSHSVSFLF